MAPDTQTLWETAVHICGSPRVTFGDDIPSAYADKPMPKNRPNKNGSCAKNCSLWRRQEDTSEVRNSSPSPHTFAYLKLVVALPLKGKTALFPLLSGSFATGQKSHHSWSVWSPSAGKPIRVLIHTAQKVLISFAILRATCSVQLWHVRCLLHFFLLHCHHKSNPSTNLWNGNLLAASKLFRHSRKATLHA